MKKIIKERNVKRVGFNGKENGWGREGTNHRNEEEYGNIKNKIPPKPSKV
jgi:hypothetical protein